MINNPASTPSPSIIFSSKPLRTLLKTSLLALTGLTLITQSSLSLAENINGKNLFTQRCAMCHGADIKATGPLARKSTPPTPDLTTPAFKKRLNEYPGVIVSSVILRPNGNLIPKTLQENGMKIAPHAWSVKDFRDLNQYMSEVISRAR
ncbi:c-type cytochrome [Pseudomonas fluorescens]|uniref:c-type cytochrome n=1 Tax=Pseudomonas TaxID=286 RepID=UPI00211855A1|nr:c-type cytochrome [Pseudomonas sp. Pse1]